MNKDYIVVENGLFKDSFTEEVVVNKELRQRVISKSRRAGFSGPTLDIPFYTGVEGHRQFQEALQGVVQDPVIFNTAGEHTTAEEYTIAAEEIWTDLRNEIPTPEVDLSIMTEQEIINHFDTISNE